MRYHWFLVVSIALWSLSCLAVQSQELEMRDEIDRQVDIMFQRADFAGLEAMAEQFRNTDERTSSGIQKLNLFYAGIKDSAEKIMKYQILNWDELSDRADAWVDAYPDSPTAAIAKAVILSNYAWHIRGGGYASTVDPDAWAPFYERLAVADRFLLQTKDYAASDPSWYRSRAIVLNHLGAEPDVFMAFLDEALDRHPNFYEIYFAAVEYLVPKWHGDARQIEMFANAAVERTRAEEGNALYARIYWFAAQTQYDLSLFTASDVSWTKMRNGIVDVLDQYPDQWNIQNFALFACLAQDVDMTRSLFLQMDEKPIMRAWRSLEVLDYCRAFAGVD